MLSTYRTDEIPCMIVPFHGSLVHTAAAVLAYVEGFAAAGGDVRKVGLSCEHMEAVRAANYSAAGLLEGLREFGTEQLVIYASPKEEAPAP